MAKKAPNKNKYAFAKAALRRASVYWYALKEAMDSAKVSRGIWKCAHCNEHFKKHEVQRDHIQPVVSVNADKVNDMNSYVETLFCDPSNIQILCKPCHALKTSIEGEQRVQARKERAGAKPKKPCKKKGEENGNTK